jgi:hypothetical protein
MHSARGITSDNQKTSYMYEEGLYQLSFEYRQPSVLFIKTVKTIEDN